MPSSLALRGLNCYRGPQKAPVGDSSSFLSAVPRPVPVAGHDLMTVIRARDGVGRIGSSVVYAPRPTVASAPPMTTGVGQFDVKHLADGTFTEQTIDAMHRAVLSCKTSAPWRSMWVDVRRIGRENGVIGWKDYLGEVKWLDHWFRKVHPIDYVRDPQQVELVKSPWITYDGQEGDCDDSSALWCAAASVLGAPYRFRTYRADPMRPHDWSHVVGQVYVPNAGWINEDLTILGAPLGFEPTGYPFKDWPEPRY